MYCTRCGKEIRSDQKFCGNCGAKNVNYQEKNNLKEIIEKAAAGEENAQLHYCGPISSIFQIFCVSKLFSIHSAKTV